MTEQERRFKITQLKKYDKQISEQKNSAISHACMAFMGAAGATLCFSVIYTSNLTETYELFEIFLAAVNAGCSLSHLAGTIIAINKKTLFEEKRFDIASELEFKKTEKEKSRGGR